MPRLHIFFFVVIAIACATTPARAAVWGYIDEQGQPHIATEKLDERYQLFFKGPTSAELAAKPQSSDSAFETTTIFRRMANHPNVKRYEPLIVRYAKEQKVEVALVKAIVAVESAYEPTAVSNKGALGLMQIVPDTAARYGVTDDAKRTVEEKLFDPAINIRTGTRYLRDLLELFAHDVTLTLAAYNAGEAAVQRYDNQVPPYPETQEFVKLVTQFYALYKPAAPQPASSRITIPRRRDAPPR